MAYSTTDERSPLLGRSVDSSAALQVDAAVHNEDGVLEAPSIREPSNARLALIMGSIWVNKKQIAILNCAG
jgi:hypothetical protein